MMKIKVRELFKIPLAFIALIGSINAIAIAPATKFNISLTNADSSSYSLTLNSSLIYFEPAPPNPLPDHSPTYNFIYDESNAPPKPLGQGAPGEFLGPTMTYTSLSSPSYRYCKFGFTGNSTDGCTVYVENPPPSKSVPQEGPQLCYGAKVSYDETTTTCTLVFTIGTPIS
jgi:hypothetical protein